MKKTIILVRHGEPETGYTKRFLGRLNPTLSPAGIDQARAIASRVAALAPQRIISSPLRRARDTAQFIADACRLPLETNPLLLEIDFGKLEGMTFKEASAIFPGVTDSWQALAGDFSFPEGEKFQDFDQRCQTMAEDVLNCSAPSVALVAHGGVLRGILCHLLNVRADGPLRFRLAYAALTTIDVDDDGNCVMTGFNIGRALNDLHPVETK